MGEGVRGRGVGVGKGEGERGVEGLTDGKGRSTWLREEENVTLFLHNIRTLINAKAFGCQGMKSE